MKRYTLEARLGKLRVRRSYDNLTLAREDGKELARSAPQWGSRDFITITDNHVSGEPPTMADHAEAWQRENGRTVPARNTRPWLAMYYRWHRYAFPKA